MQNLRTQELAKILSDASLRGFDPYFSAAQDALVETARAVTRFQPFNSSHEGFAVLQEEVHELWDAIGSNDLVEAREQAIQVAAIALRFIAEMPPTKKYEPREKEDSCRS